jgi:2-keto-3-deoxy-L-fuconate dehydrogenase
MLSLQDKIAAVTGGGSGIGKETALLFAKQGATVYVLDVNESAADATVNEIKQGGGNGFAVRCDVTDQSDVASVFSSIDALNILVNSAGISHVGNIENTTEQDFDKLYSVNVKGVYNCMKAVVPLMRNLQGGVIVNLASIANHVGLADRFSYSMTKGAVHAMTMSVARDYVSSGIRCNSVSPARVHTPFVDGFIKKNYPGREHEMFQQLSKSQPIGRMARPSEVATVILYLCSDEASFITGSDYAFDGGVIHLNV